MPSKPPIVFPQEQRLLAALGERLRMARLRRKLTTTTVAQRAGISRSSLYNAERGDPGATLGTYLRIMAVLGLETDINALAADDKVGRKLQDLALAACRTWGVESENRPQRGQFLPHSPPHSPAMGQEGGEKWTAAVDLQPTIPKSDRLLGPEKRARVQPGLAMTNTLGVADASKPKRGRGMALK